jgi:sulfur relay protein TusB/DsrH
MTGPATALHVLATDSSDVLARVADQLQERDAVVLLAEATWLLCNESSLRSLARAGRLGCLALDAAARGLAPAEVPGDIEWLDDQALVEWVAQHPHCLTWK